MRGRYGWGAAFALLRLYAVFAAWAGRRELPGVCVYRRLTGRRCLFCGLTHAVADALRGDLRRSTEEHRLAQALILVAVGDVAFAVGRARRTSRSSGTRHAPVLVVRVLRRP